MGIPALDARAPGARATETQSASPAWGAADFGWVGALGTLLAASIVIAHRAGVFASLRRQRGRDVGIHPWWYWLAAGIAVEFGGSIGAALGIAAGDGLGFKPRSLAMDGLVAIAGSVAGITVGVLVVATARRAAADPARAGLTPRWADAGVGLLALLLALPAVQLAAVAGFALHQVVTGVGPDPIAHATLFEIRAGRGDPWVWAVILSATLLGPIVEELVFRVCVQSAVLRLTRRPWAAVLLTGVLFALMHRVGPQPVPWHAIGSLAVLGVALGAAYERTRRLGVPIVMHAAFNAGNVAMALWWVEPPGRALP